MITLPVSVIAGLVTSKVLLHQLTDQQFAVASLLSTAPLLFPVFDLGLGAELTNVSAKINENPDEFFKVSSQAVRNLVLVAAFIGGLVLLVEAATMRSQIEVFGSVKGTRAAIAIFAMTLLPSAPLGLAARVLIGLGKTHIHVMWQACVPIITAAITLVFVAAHCPWWVYVTNTSIAITAVSAIEAAIAVTSLEVSHARDRRRDQENSHTQHSGPRIAYAAMVVSVAIPATFHTDRWILAMRGDASDIVRYSLLSAMYMPALSVVNSMGLTMWSRFALQQHRFRSLGQQLTLVSGFTGVAILGGAIYVVVAPTIASWVSSGRLHFSLESGIPFAILLVIMAAHQPAAMLLTDQGGLKFQAYASTGMAVSSLLLTWWLAHSFHEAGPVLASVVSVAVFMLIPCLSAAAYRSRRVQVDAHI